jgi:alginate O-acetyltransferase complex protein AlgI
MVFSSLIFLYIFLPLCAAVYFLAPNIRAKNIVLIVFSIVFYAWGEPLYVLLLVAMSGVNWHLGRLLETKREKKLLTLAIVLDLACLAVFKYTGFFVRNLNALGLGLPVPKITLPIGISFYTFQALSYIIDVWRGKVKAQKSFWRFLLYVSLFPKLVMGPIVRYADVEPQLERREIKPKEIFYGLTRFCMGLAKKVLLADYAGKVASQILDGSLTASATLSVWLGILMYTFEIYFDFSGYSDMAIGLGHVFGFRYPENFRLPYTARSIGDFWRRWHISLSSFFRDYVYIPLGGNRRHVYLNLAIVWTLTGLWHGASWNFVLWGFYFFVILALERVFKTQISKVPRAIQHIVTLFLIMIGWNLFYFTDFSRLGQSFSVLFGAAGAGFFNEQTRIQLVNNLPLIILCALGSTPIPQALGNTFGALCTDGNRAGKKQRTYVIVTYAYDLLLLALSTIALIGTSYKAFLYFSF